jgi:hypothetical protein
MYKFLPPAMAMPMDEVRHFSSKSGAAPFLLASAKLLGESKL